MMDSFTSAEVDTGEAVIFVRSHGSGPAVLLLHGFPQTHLMWRAVAPVLAHTYTIVCADLRGYGRSSCPASTVDHAPYAKRAMAKDMIAVMGRLGFSRFAVAGHDRGGRVAYRMALDFPSHVERLAVLDILPIETVWDHADARFALGYWPWSLLACGLRGISRCRDDRSRARQSRPREGASDRVPAPGSLERRGPPRYVVR